MKEHECEFGDSGFCVHCGAEQETEFDCRNDRHDWKRTGRESKDGMEAEIRCRVCGKRDLA